MSKTRLAIIAIIYALLLTVSLASAQADMETEPNPDPVKYVTIYTESDGETHFKDELIELSIKNYVPPAIPLAVSTPAKAKAVAFLSTPAGWIGDWHHAATTQFVFVLAGEIEVEVSDGDVRKFKPGSVLLAADIAGKGHITRNVGGDTLLLAVVPIDPR
jgi:quercetin dioxygenase-like cupin family protein